MIMNSSTKPGMLPGTQYIPANLLLQWHITERCNLRCRHCYQDGYRRDELSLNALLAVLRQYTDLLQQWRSRGRTVRGHITVTGGEPFIRDDFLDLLDVFSANRESFTFAILTNGSFIDTGMARKLRKLRPAFVQVSIEGDRTTHDNIRGRGNFDKTVAAIKHLVRQKIRTLISFTAHKGNYRQFGEVARLGIKLKVARVWADRLIPRGSGSDMAEQVLGPAETREFFEIMRKYRQQAQRSWFVRTDIAMHRALQFLVGRGRPYHCTAGDALVTVQPNGDLYPCRRMPIRVGNLMEKPLGELYYQSDLLCALRYQGSLSDSCEDCSYAGLCRGGLRCLSYAVTGDPFKADPGCWRASVKHSAVTAEMTLA